MTALADDLVEVTELEQGRHPSIRRRVVAPTGLWPRRWWLGLLGALGVWAFWDAMVGRSLLNPGGWTLARHFAAAAVSPELDAAFVRIVVDAAATTVAYEMVGTGVALVLGAVGGVVSSETW